MLSVFLVGCIFILFCKVLRAFLTLFWLFSIRILLLSCVPVIVKPRFKYFFTVLYGPSVMASSFMLEAFEFTKS